MATARRAGGGLPPDRRARARRRPPHVALVGTNGTIDWYCCPASTRRACSGRSSTRTRAASTRCARTAEEWTSKQLYFPDTNVLITRFFTEDGVGEVQDFMPIDHAALTMHRHRLMRRVVVVRGQMDFQIEVQPRFDYGRAEHEVEMHPHGVLFRSPDLTLALEGAIAAHDGPRAAARAPTAASSRDVRLPRATRRRSCSSACPGPHLPRPTPSARRSRRSRPPSATGAVGRPVALPGPLARDGACARR